MKPDADNNLSVVLYAKRDLRLENRSVPQPGNNEVQIAINKVGICGSDVHYWSDGKHGEFVLTDPLVIGHESSGTVTSIGNGVSHLKIGDRVAIEPATPCRLCFYCKSGRYNMCLDVKGLATPPTDGSLCRYFVHAADLCHKIPDKLTFEDGALAEPLSCGIHACRRAGVSLGDKVLVLGAGPIGIICMLVAKSMGASEILITDIDAERLNFAKKVGADHTLLIEKQQIPELVETIVATFGGEMADITIECSGAESSIRLGVYATRPCGVLQLVGIGKQEVMFPIVNAAIREVDIRGMHRYVNTYPTALKMMASGAIDASVLITHRFTLEQTLAAFETFCDRASGAVKVMIECSSPTLSSST
ncbi:sorbitol dehydrogenase-like [Tubulanus polymorphus]|uniref:sorbitol dehydrogenase-like n=1 Tax=Tubulanus polymorphus TaxID=672921 RepID=UPI003DA6CC3B